MSVNIAMAYVDAASAKAGTEVAVKVGKRATEVAARLAKMPFVKTNYYSLKQ